MNKQEYNKALKQLKAKGELTVDAIMELTDQLQQSPKVKHESLSYAKPTCLTSSVNK